MHAYFMGILTAIHHVTHYHYDRPVTLGMQTIRLRPAPHTRSPIGSYSLKINPKEHFINWQQDPFGNYLAQVVFPKKTTEFKIEVDVVAEIRVFNPFDFFLEDYAKDFPFSYETGLKEELVPYLEIKERGVHLKKFLAPIDRSRQGVIDFLVGLNQKLHLSLKYVVRLEPGIQSCEETLLLKSGSCRDMAWLLCQILRHLGFATRFASGYLIQLKADGKSLDGPSGTDVDFTDLHAWTEVYLPGAGWVGLDPTSGLFAGESHIPLCCTPNPSSAAPITGSIDTCQSTLTHTMTLTRLHEEHRVTKPYTEASWQKIDALGLAVDKALKKHDVRLTLGGEPTFVSLDDREGDEWHFTALSDNKSALGNSLLRRLRDSFAPTGLLQYSQDKWYPGEVLPRWAMNCYWRKDGESLWDDASLLAHPTENQGHSLPMAKTFLTHLAVTLGIPENYILSALEASSKKILGYVLPLKFSPRRKQWISNLWKFANATKTLSLIPGDSPMGLRLPLSRLPSVNEKLAAEELCPERSPFAKVAALPKKETFLLALKKRWVRKGKALPAFAKDPSGLVRSALCVEVRGGILHLFLPPLPYAEHFLELIAMIENVAGQLKMPVVLEGYSPPKDQRIGHFSVTPDPGVLEVNIQPAESWSELKTIIGKVYEAALKTRLVSEKFLIDGRHVGTGGGNHIVVGAAIATDSPFLRRPDLLRSLVTFWQNHPALSYLFSGMYIGPTSQAPRIDEARNDSLYELELAFKQIPHKKNVPPWLVDRLLRNILVDLTGNTHRAEFCIDKLYSPDSDRGRLGLLEMRGFEMTPHPQMNLLQALLIRAAIATFWQSPYVNKLVRFGNQLHDRYLLPHYVWQDFGEVLHFFKTAGYTFDLDWFKPFYHFRFPKYGAVQVGSLSLELRMALEPWPVMGDELSIGGTSRSVDSSVERLEVKISGAIQDYHIVTCNRRRLPLHPTAQKDVLVAGVRYKAWAPPSCLHPTIPVHTPLIFDVIDTRFERSLGGCTYHVAHPGGRNYETLPVNENEAEGRRLSRFQAMGHSPGRVVVPQTEQNPDFPHTLDLRS